MPKGIPNTNRYENCPAKLKTAFYKYLQSKKNTLARKVKNIEAECIHMSWQDEENTTDCGVYCMRHMETYKGTAVDKWETGFVGGDSDAAFITSLRAKYAANIIMWKQNEYMETVMQSARDNYKKEK
ncbi:PREDICTED: uncharacterized protein LOC109153493 [Ipomoea nil]|uniref:uncharacterized protein LOC109153493 n=1 Tax=Ipomoea nil TaxID=35883 RepID=UPI00090112AB|nr:PREDICTED: uncharacterized protein LOC109153493 [Ipomoea nil]